MNRSDDCVEEGLLVFFWHELEVFSDVLDKDVDGTLFLALPFRYQLVHSIHNSAELRVD